MNERKPWTVEEDVCCCKVCIDLYVVQKEKVYIEECVEKIKSCSEMNGRDKGSIRMRVQNIKALLKELKIQNTLDVRPLANAAKQTRDILEACLENANIKV